MDIKLPALGEGADSGTVVDVLVRVGDRVEKDQTIIELENEKAVASIPSTAAGRVMKLHIREGDKIRAGDVILSLLQRDEDTAADKDTGLKSKKDAERPSSAGIDLRSKETEVRLPEPDARLAGCAIKTVVGPPASPSIRKIARDLGIDLDRIRGSERGGRIVLGDLRAYIERLQQIAFQGGSAELLGTPRVDYAMWGAVCRRPLSPLRQAIGRRMSAAWHAVPHVTQFDECDITDLVTLKRRYEAAYEERGARLTLMPFVLKALIPVLKEDLVFNASLDTAANEIVLKQYFHIGIAVDTDYGLLVPVLRDADGKSMLDLAREIERLARKARDRKLSAEEMSGGSFTITNQGGIGGTHFTPIVNAPEVAILGMGRARTKPAVRGNCIEPRVLLPLCLSYDHRVIDGAGAARFMERLIGRLESFCESEVML